MKYTPCCNWQFEPKVCDKGIMDTVYIKLLVYRLPQENDDVEQSQPSKEWVEFQTVES